VLFFKRNYLKISADKDAISLKFKIIFQKYLKLEEGRKVKCIKKK
jgi:hypothetical protein